jgi:hypothetical protein
MSYGINHQMDVKASPEEIYKYLPETAADGLGPAS